MKLTALTVVGFKSFADKTVFQFHDGVTCVVGPNGCGKSNVIDAFKWVLGEQSAKSLRGGEMMDVIFNGTSQRKAAAFAEVSLTLEDFGASLPRPQLLEQAPSAEGQAAPPAGEPQADEASLPADATPTPAQPQPETEAPAAQDEIFQELDSALERKPSRVRSELAGQTVSVTRRLYRSGESEYLVNGQSARLRDIREMFMDTGVGIDAYSLIEQGKVEAFLQASSEDRRLLFDEAAGISKYLARKREALRRLERVEQNLLRLTDILDEVSKRLRSIKYQAGKARNYQAYTTELKELRSLFSLAEYHNLAQQRRTLQGQADALADTLSGLSAQIDRLDASGAASETELADLDRLAHELDGRIGGLCSQIAGCEQRAEMLARRAMELADQITSQASRCEQLEAKVEANRVETVQQREAQTALGEELIRLEEAERGLRGRHVEGLGALQELSAKLDDEKNGTIDLLRRTAQLHNEINSHGLRRENLHSQRQRLVGRAAEIARALEDLLTRRSETNARLQDVTAVLTESQQRLEQSQQQAKELDASAQQLSAERSSAQQEQSGLTSRQNVLLEMQSRLEGVNEGTRRILQQRGGRCAFVRGALAEFIETDVAHAGVIEAALAEAQQRLVVDRLDEVLAHSAVLAEVLGEKAGADFICLDRAALPAPAGDQAAGVSGDMRQDAAIIARASDWVRCQDELAPLMQLLLGRTLIVQDLAAAARLSAGLPGWRFVTQDGAVLEADGRVRLGAARGTPGMIWRRSELADLDRRLDDIQRKVDDLTARLEEVKAQRKHTEELIHALRTSVYEASTEKVEHQTVIRKLDEQVAQYQREEPLLAQEVQQLAAEIDKAVAQEHQAKERAAELEGARQEREARIAQLIQEHRQGQERQDAVAAELSGAQIARASARQKHSGMEEAIRRMVAAGDSMSMELMAGRQQIEEARGRREEALAQAQEARQQIEGLMAQRQVLQAEALENAESRKTLHVRLTEIRQQLSAERKRQEELAGQHNALKVQLSEVEVRVETLIARTREELGMDLPAMYAGYQHDDQRDWEAVKNQIADLRGKIERLGNVNLDAIGEQEELAQREQFLTVQLQDVRASQRQLDELIKRINAESRRRFEESFIAVRAQFGELFRKLFGGGKADILLTQPEDVLESPIEIVARPPGKELRSITLMSGGEKTLTTLALLFSFFRVRPSPFCLLDEVDAALDEANTTRFTQLVREFLSLSQFIIISHSKRTIAMGDQIYGVTMQEPGVSRQISVRFEEAQRLIQPAAKPAKLAPADAAEAEAGVAAPAAAAVSATASN